jgi:hypothetical protein
MFGLSRLSAFHVILSMIIMSVILIGMAIRFYPDRLQFRDPISYAGQAKAANGLPNWRSEIIYGADMAVDGCLMLVLAAHYRQRKDRPQNARRAWFSLLGCAGFFVTSVSPNDTRHIFHVIASTITITALWLLATNHICEVRHALKAFRYFALQAILQIPVFGYAITYYSDMYWWSPIWQKYAIATLVICLLYITKFCQSVNISPASPPSAPGRNPA